MWLSWGDSHTDRPSAMLDHTPKPQSTAFVWVHKIMATLFPGDGLNVNRWSSVVAWRFPVLQYSSSTVVEIYAVTLIHPWVPILQVEIVMWSLSIVIGRHFSDHLNLSMGKPFIVKGFITKIKGLTIQDRIHVSLTNNHWISHRKRGCTFSFSVQCKRKWKYWSHLSKQRSSEKRR